jgi:prepilin-type N-terminal cleavage/methylation domain-containing protein
LRGKKRMKTKGFTLVEVLIAAAILAVIIVGMIQIFIYSSTAAALAGSKTLAVISAQNKLEEIRNHSFDEIVSHYASDGEIGPTFIPQGIDGIGVVYINADNPSLLVVRVVVCWRDKRERIIGEDLNLNGVLDEGEDLAGGIEGEIDSIVSITTRIAKR